jgi:uncharacterized protein (DUF1330 family)
MGAKLVMPGHSGRPRADCVNLSAMPGIHVLASSRQDVGGRDEPGHDGKTNRATAELESAMTVYVIAQLKMTDRAAYDRYQARFFDVFRKFNGRLLSADERPSVVEGDWNRDKLVLMSFPDEAAYHAWADSLEYLEISKDRKAGAQAIVLLAKGFAPAI